MRVGNEPREVHGLVWYVKKGEVRILWRVRVGTDSD